MELSNLYSVFPLVNAIYGIDPDENDFEDIALYALSKIQSRHTRLYRYTADVENGVMPLPCNVTSIESVTIPLPEAKVFGSQFDGVDHGAVWAEAYTDAFDLFKSQYNEHGKLVKYEEGNNELYFDHDYHHVTVLYHGVLVDEEKGLPLITDKEAQAVACYIAYNAMMKEGIKKRDQGALTIAQTLKGDWLQLCNAARIPEHLSQNDMDKILDVRVRWDRKAYGKSFKAVL